jgi:hypothetical protein
MSRIEAGWFVLSPRHRNEWERLNLNRGAFLITYSLFPVYAALSIFAGNRTPIIRLSGRSAHDTTARPQINSGVMM